MKKKIDVCISPDLLNLYDIRDKVVVVVDILRATSCMTTAIAHGVKSITPVATLEECKKLQAEGYIAAAERDGKMAQGFDLGNSPFSYMSAQLKGRQIALTTTNGTVAITRSRHAHQVIVGSFLNLSAVIDYLKSQNRNVLISCAGWKGKFNLEDTLYAGALVSGLKDDFESGCDAPIAAESLYDTARSNLFEFLSNSSHVNRLRRLNIQKDIDFCLNIDEYKVIPVLKDGQIVEMGTERIVSQKSAGPKSKY